MPILGAHQSISGGYHCAVERASQCGCDCVQLFTKNNNQWAAKPITQKEVEQFQAACLQYGIAHPIAHDSYLINLASPEDRLWHKSVQAFIEELRRAELLGIPYVVTHPGSFTTSDEPSGLERIIEALDLIHSETTGLHARCLLETTAGQGSTLGWRFEQLGYIFHGVSDSSRLGVCFDTCHVFAAGYPLGKKGEYRATMAEFDREVGIDRILAFHLNDSRRELGSRVDRHEHIGRGALGIDAFRNLLCDERFQQTPMYLETPKGMENGINLDEINLETLRQLSPKKRS